MKKRNWFLLLFAVLLVAFIVAFVVVYRLVLKDGDVSTEQPSATTEVTEEPTDNDAHVLEHPTLLTNMSEYSLKKFTLNQESYMKNDSDQFYSESYPDWPLDQAMLWEMAIAFTQISSTYLVERSYGSAAYGFTTDDEPTFTIEDELGTTIDIWIGNKCDLDNRYYAASSFEDGIYLIDFDKSLLEIFPQNLVMMDSIPPYFDNDRLQSVVLKNGEGEVVHSAPQPGGEPLEGWEFLGYIGFSPSDIQSGNPSNAQLADWKLDQAHALFAEVEYLNEENKLGKFNCKFGKLNVEEKEISGEFYKQYSIYVQFDRIVYLLPMYLTDEVAAVILNLQAE